MSTFLDISFVIMFNKANKIVAIRDMPDSLWRRAKAMAARKGWRLPVLIVRALTEYLDREETAK